jgi:hypothetical protein
LDFKKLRLYKIIKKILDVNFRLQLLKGSQVHLVFYVSLLSKALPNAKTNNKEIQLAKELDVYNVKKILASRISNSKIEYLIK